MSTVRIVDDSIQIFRGDADDYEITLTRNNAQIWFAAGASTPAGVVKVVDDDNTVLIDEQPIPVFGVEGTDDYTLIARIGAAASTGALRNSERARLVVRIDDDGEGSGPQTWDNIKRGDVRIYDAR